MATFTKLKSGDWGIRVEGKTQEGANETVTKKSGEKQIVKVAKVVWTDGKISLCTIESDKASGSKSTPPGKCCNCGGPLNQWERSHGVRRCIECRDGGGNARGGQSYYDRNGNFVLGDDD